MNVYYSAVLVNHLQPFAGKPSESTAKRACPERWFRLLELVSFMSTNKKSPADATAGPFSCTLARAMQFMIRF
jgi:hypothetical protein